MNGAYASFVQINDQDRHIRAPQVATITTNRKTARHSPGIKMRSCRTARDAMKASKSATLLFPAVIIAGFIGGQSAGAQPAAGPPAVAPAQVDAIFADRDRTDSPGCALAVMHGGAIVYEHGYGMADLEHDATIRGNTPFHVASISKQFTAAAIVLLAQEGKLSLDDEIHKYLPELAAFGAPITIRQLLHHTSGLLDQWELLQLAGYRYSLDLITDQDVMSLVDRQRELNFPPGSRFLYSNTGYTLLGQIVQRVSGQSLREFTTSRILKPLGMSHTHFRDDHAEVIRGEALGYERNAAGAFRLSVTNFDTVGATSLYTTVEDLANWDENFYRPIIGGPSFAQTMTHTDKLTTGGSNNYALGLELGRYRGLPIVEHGGSDAGYRADFLRFPTQHFSVATLCNTPTRPGPDALSRRVADLYLAADFTEKPVESFAATERSADPSLDLSGRSGYYMSRDLDVVIQIDAAQGVLQYLVSGRMQPLLPYGRGLYRFPESTDLVRFEPADGQAERLIITIEGQPAQIWDRLRVPASSAAEPGDYVGKYYSPELDVFYEVAVSNTVLHLRRPRHLDDRLLPIGGDLFGDPVLPGRWMGTVRFTRDTTNRVSGMKLAVGRSHNLTFVRQRAQCNADAETLCVTWKR